MQQNKMGLCRGGSPVGLELAARRRDHSFSFVGEEQWHTGGQRGSGPRFAGGAGAVLAMAAVCEAWGGRAGVRALRGASQGPLGERGLWNGNRSNGRPLSPQSPEPGLARQACLIPSMARELPSGLGEQSPGAGAGSARSNDIMVKR